jgi:hypothetical protein
MNFRRCSNFGQTAIDTYAKVTFAPRFMRKKPLTAADRPNEGPRGAVLRKNALIERASA